MGLFGRKKKVAEEVLVAEGVIGVTNTGEEILINVQNGSCYCSNNDLVKLNVAKPELITKLYCFDNQLTSLPDGMVNLKELWCYNNQLTSLPEDMVNLTELWCYDNQLTSLPKGMVKLQSLSCGGNKISSIPEGMLNLGVLECDIDIPEYLKNQLLSVKGTTADGKIKYFDVKYRTCRCANENLVSLEVTNPGVLKELDCSFNQLTSLPDGMVNLESLFCSGNPDLVIPEYLKHLVK